MLTTCMAVSMCPASFTFIFTACGRCSYPECLTEVSMCLLGKHLLKLVQIGSEDISAGRLMYQWWYINKYIKNMHGSQLLLLCSVRLQRSGPCARHRCGCYIGHHPAGIDHRLSSQWQVRKCLIFIAQLDREMSVGVKKSGWCVENLSTLFIMF